MSYLPAHAIRGLFATAMSKMYQDEVPLYGDLLAIVERVNEDKLESDPGLATELAARDELGRLGAEYHGAIRLGTAFELNTMRRLFAVMGMFPVGYYDLSVAGLPVHATAFRPTDPANLNREPFRIFTSLLRLELIEDQPMREEIAAILETRSIFSDPTISLIERFERDGGLDESSSRDFVGHAVETFRWHSESPVEVAVYRRLHEAHRLFADVACFKGPHINHLTPRTLDIDAAQAAMVQEGIDAKEVIEGPPRRRVPILLRQTSFKALNETVLFAGSAGPQSGTHTARFGEIEQRGMALTRKGQALYDELLAKARIVGDAPYEERLADAFRAFPDDLDTIRLQGLGHFHYRAVEGARHDPTVTDLDTLVADGAVEAFPITYEDFLPVSAAGIFHSNLGDDAVQNFSAAASQAAFEASLGCEVVDLAQWYEDLEHRSLERARDALSVPAIDLQSR